MQLQKLAALALAFASAASAGTQSVFSTQPGSTVIGAALSPSGTLFTAARDSNALFEYSSTCVPSTFATVSSPYGIAINSAGDIFVGANSGFNIDEYTPQGVESAFGTPGQEDFSLAVDASGDLFEGDVERQHLRIYSRRRPHHLCFRNRRGCRWTCLRRRRQSSRTESLNPASNPFGSFLPRAYKAPSLRGSICRKELWICRPLRRPNRARRFFSASGLYGSSSRNLADVGL